MQNPAHRSLRKLKIDLIQLELAFDNNSFEMQYYLDLHTGQVMLITDEIRQKLEDIYEELNAAGDEGFRHFTEAAQKRNLPDWQKEMLFEAHHVEEHLGTRYVQVPIADVHEAYDDMEDYIETVRGARLQEEIWEAIRGRGAFRRFKELLADYPQERERWFKFQDERVRQRMLDWLAEQGIDPLP